MVTRFLTILTLLIPAVNLAAQVVVKDEGVEISYTEMEAILANNAPRLVKMAADDTGDRFELLNQIMVARKLSREADKLTPDDPGYWELYFKLEFQKEKFAFARLVDQITVPPLDDLAEERFRTEKDKYARIPELRSSSHILFRSPPGQDRTELRLKAAGILEQLQAGADFEQLVAEYSEDPGTRARNGALDKQVRFGDPSITPPYTEALFAIETVGGYSEVTDSQFGLHIIRLDGITPSGYHSFEQVKPQIIADLQAEYMKLAKAELRMRYHITDEAFIDGEAMEKLFAPYKTRP